MPFTISSAFDPSRGLLGGAILGLSASGLVWAAGKITGISGMLESFLKGSSTSSYELAYFGGLATAGAAVVLLAPAGSNAAAFGAVAAGGSLLLRLLGGAIVGYGARLGSGCTSGHGVCGVPRLSPRSLTAVLTFMATGAATSTLLGSMGLLKATPAAGLLSSTGSAAAAGGISTSSLALSLGLLAAAVPLQHLLVGKAHTKKQHSHSHSHSHGHEHAAPLTVFSPRALAYQASNYLAGLTFGVGLLLSGMTNPSKVLGFLDLSGNAGGLAPGRGWDPTLMCVMGAAVAVNFITFRLLNASSGRPLLKEPHGFLHEAPAAVAAAGAGAGAAGGATPAGAATSETVKPSSAAAAASAAPGHHVHTPHGGFSELLPLGTAGRNRDINSKLLLGAALFGIGWGLQGVCPGPALVAAAGGQAAAMEVLAGMALGMLLQNKAHA